VLGIVGLLVLFAIGTADIMPFTGRPDQITTKIEEGEQRFAAKTISPEDEQEWKIKEEDRPRKIVEDGMLANLSPSTYQLEVKFAPSFLDRQTPLQEVNFLKIDQLTASQGKRLLHMGVYQDEETLADADADSGEKPPAATVDTAPPGVAGIPGLGTIDGSQFAVRNGGLTGGASDEELAIMDQETSMLPELAYPTGFGEEGGMSEATLQLNGRGHYFVSVRGVVPVRDNIEAIMTACNVTEQEATELFYMIDFNLERQQRNSDGTWTEWAPVDRTLAETIFKTVDGFEPEPVPPGVLDSVITMPYPALITGTYGDHQIHPQIANFKLSPEKLRLQGELELKQAQEYQKQMALRGVDPRAINRPTKAGWSDFIHDGKDMFATTMGEPSGSGYINTMPTGPGRSSMSPSGRPGMNPGPGGGADPSGVMGASTGPTPEQKKKMQELVKSLVDSEIGGKASKADRDKLEKEFYELLQQNVSAVGNVLLFRYIDFAVEPNETYRYQARLVMANPNAGRRVTDAEEPSVVQGDERLTEWSNTTNPATIERQTWYFVNSLDTRKNQIKLDFVTYDLDYGTSVTNNYKLADAETSKRLTVQQGDTIGGVITVPLLDPAKNTFDDTEYSFDSKDLLVDVLPDVILDKSLHPDLGITVGSAKPLQVGDAMLVFNHEKELATVDTFSQQPVVDYFFKGNPPADIKSYLEQQFGPWESMRTSPSIGGEGSSLEELYGEDMMMADGMYGMEEEGTRKQTRRRNVNRKRSSGADISRRMEEGP